MNLQSVINVSNLLVTHSMLRNRMNRMFLVDDRVRFLSRKNNKVIVTHFSEGRCSLLLFDDTYKHEVYLNLPIYFENQIELLHKQFQLLQGDRFLANDTNSFVILDTIHKLVTAKGCLHINTSPC